MERKVRPAETDTCTLYLTLHITKVKSTQTLLPYSTSSRQRIRRFVERLDGIEYEYMVKVASRYTCPLQLFLLLPVENIS